MAILFAVPERAITIPEIMKIRSVSKDSFFGPIFLTKGPPKKPPNMAPIASNDTTQFHKCFVSGG
eukprot:Awhi_evm2s15516